MLFNYDSYIELIKMLKDSCYRLTSFLQEEDTQSPQAILRHDVDVSPQKALNMATIEEMEKVHSTYFFMISSGLYNLMERENEKALMEIMDMGHEIGLHFDLSKYPITNLSELEPYLLHELDILGTLISYPVKAVSWHIPSNIVLGKTLPFLDDRWIKNAYDPKYFYRCKYLSDSNMRWREEPKEYIDSKRFPNLQILTHPVWYWDAEINKRSILNMEYATKVDSMFRCFEVISPIHER